MPCISDPGALFVDFCQKNSIRYDVIPGANAAITSYAMSGFNQKEFLFFGFLHNKGNKRLDEIKKLLKSSYPVIIYESPERVLKLVEEIAKIDEMRDLFLVKEISKLHQRTFRGKACEVLEKLKEANLKGEWVVILSSKEESIDQSALVEAILELEISTKDKSKILGKLTDKPSKQWYKELL